MSQNTKNQLTEDNAKGIIKINEVPAEGPHTITLASDGTATVTSSKESAINHNDINDIVANTITWDVNNGLHDQQNTATNDCIAITFNGSYVITKDTPAPQILVNGIATDSIGHTIDTTGNTEVNQEDPTA